MMVAWAGNGSIVYDLTKPDNGDVATRVGDDYSFTDNNIYRLEDASPQYDGNKCASCQRSTEAF